MRELIYGAILIAPVILIFETLLIGLPIYWMWFIPLTIGGIFLLIVDIVFDNDLPYGKEVIFTNNTFKFELKDTAVAADENEEKLPEWDPSLKSIRGAIIMFYVRNEEQISFELETVEGQFFIVNVDKENFKKLPDLKLHQVVNVGGDFIEIQEHLVINCKCLK